MSRTDKTDPTWVKQRRAKKFSASHNCRQHGQRRTSVARDCDLPACPDGKRHDRRDWNKCSWEAEFTYFEWSRMFEANPGMRTERHEWHNSDRAANRDVSRAMLREYNAGHGINDDPVRVEPHRHTGRWDW